MNVETSPEKPKSQWRIFLAAFALYLLIFSYPEILLHVTSIGDGGHETLVWDRLYNALIFRTFFLGPIAFAATFGAMLLASGILIHFLATPIKWLIKRQFSPPIPILEYHILLVACILTCLWKLQLEIVNPQTSQRQFTRDIGIRLPATINHYRAYHHTGGFATSWDQKFAYYSFTTDSVTFSQLAKDLNLEPTPKEANHLMDRGLLYLPETFKPTPTMDEYDIFEATNRSNTSNSHIRFVLHNTKSSHTIMVALRFPK